VGLDADRRPVLPRRQSGSSRVSRPRWCR
jgi:hypothetical protein